MSILSYKTKKGSLVRGMPRVYFCCHPKDFDVFFEDISSEILSRQNCSIWHHGKEIVEYTDEIFEDLLQMNLFVVPVTDRFLQEGNPALETEFRFAVEKGIPILPLMQESGLDKRFNELCGNIQYLDKNNTDSTCIEYADKLDKFLSSVLVGDELAEKIRNAFDAYVFLSYRKKDRRYAQQLMKLIHQNEFCRDIAIWYDEFLVPGENFNYAICEALQKSDLFVLTVTPNLVNETNYIMDVEFPMAKEHKKPILPCEMVDTDKSLLAQKYENIPACTNGRDDLMLSESLREHFLSIATRENDNEPEHMFFIGLAYLNGIDVEVDRDRALKLITAAAQKDLPDAISKLISMYTNGDGVKTDESMAIKWKERLLTVTKKIYEQERDFSSAFAYVRASFELATAHYQLDLFEKALYESNELKNICETVLAVINCNRLETIHIKRHIALADLLLGQTYHETNDFKSAKDHYDLSMNLFSRLNEKHDDPMFLRDASIVSSKIAQLCKVAADYQGALNYYKKALKIQQSNAEKDGIEEHLLDQVTTQINMSEVLRLLWDTNGSKQCCFAAIDILDDLIAVGGISKYLVVKMITLIALIDSYRMEGNFVDAIKVYDDLTKLAEIYAEHYGKEHAYIRAKSLSKITQIYFQMTDYESVIKYGEQAMELIEKAKMLTDGYIALGGSDVAVIYAFVGMSYYNGRADMNTCIKYMKIAVDMAEKYLERDIVCNIPDVIMLYSFYGDCMQTAGKIAEASKYLEKAVGLYEKYLVDDENLRNMCTAFSMYVALGKNLMFKELVSNALSRLNKAQSIYKKTESLYPETTKTIERDYAQVCYLIASCYIERDNAQAKTYYLKCIEIYEKIPTNKRGLYDLNAMGIVYYQLYSLASGYSEKSKWEQRVFDAAYDIKRLYPSGYKQTYFYEALNETGAFD